MLIVLAALVLAACGSDDAPPDPYARYRAAMRPEAQTQLDALSFAPRYDLDIAFDLEESELIGFAQLTLSNNSTDPWNDLYLRLYTGLQQYGGGMTVQSVAVNQRLMPFDYEANHTAVRVDLAVPLLPEQTAIVDLKWKLKIPVWSDSVGTYALLGRSQSITSLPLFYPTLAVYLPGSTIGAGRWWLDEGSVRGDAAFNVAALFAVTATLPADQIPVTSGTLITSTVVAPDQVRYAWVTGPVREFFMQFSSRFRSATIETRGTRVTSYWLPEEEAAGRAALNYNVAALRIFSDYYGDYPFRDLVVSVAPLANRGMEYPQVSLIGSELYNRARDKLEVLIAHEVAHQWWYQIVHNDPVNEPWLDEALAEYSVKIYLEKLKGNLDAESLQLTRWIAPVALLQSRGGDEVLDRTVDSFTDAGQYETIVYGKGALFYDELRKEMGDRQFFQFLQDYLNDHRYQIVNSADWLSAIEALGKPELVQLYRQWVGAPKPTAQNSGP